ncbi:MAG: Fic family protein, partial [Chloroflexi bacterium]|nr:Fic family protein [Chloroflexota bacterium]
MQPADFAPQAPGRVVRVGQGRAAYWAFVPAPLPPRLAYTPRLLQMLSSADRAVGELAGLGRALHNPWLLVQPFLRREAVLSSRIEGTEAELSDVYAYEAGVRKGLPPDVREVHNYVRALQHGLERLQTLPVSLRLLREIHAILMEGVRGEHATPGEF